MTIEATIIPNKLRKEDIPDEQSLTYDATIDKIKVKDAGIQSNHIASGAVTTTKLADSSLKTHKIYDNFMVDSNLNPNGGYILSNGFQYLWTPGLSSNSRWILRSCKSHRYGGIYGTDIMTQVHINLSQWGAGCSFGFFYPGNEANHGVLVQGTNFITAAGGTSTTTAITFNDTTNDHRIRIVWQSGQADLYEEDISTGNFVLLASHTTNVTDLGSPVCIQLKDVDANVYALNFGRIWIL